ncbi:hypothetical protein HXX02_02580 [Microbulbifer elongatus]|uniref:Sulfotransferase domain-containing protein n=1 Tax=Microbulbifer elongatus TaxID=86173 RepID=A0ABT1NWR2_9GAMM|nr:hypothetical protein [Microbulbifer elongatus]MCQ3828323.1 hypothetical protein [Microbulbifer elongatus]
MNKLYLHVGMPKTGTSYLQAFFNLNAESIRDKHEVFVLRNRVPHNIACAHIFEKKLVDRVDISKLSLEVSAAELNSQVEEAANFKSCICSSEYFSLSRKSSVVDFFSKHFDEIEVVYTVRRQDKLLASGYNQDVKALGRTSNLTWNVDDPLMNYYSNVSEWKSLGCKVSIFNYDVLKSASNGLEKTFLSLLDISSSVDEFILPGKDGANSSLRRNEVLLKLALNRAGVEDCKVLNEFIEVNSGDVEFQLPRIYEKAILGYYAESNKKFVESFCKGEGYEDFYTIDPLSNSSRGFEWDPLREAGAVMAYLISKLSGDCE